MLKARIINNSPPSEWAASDSQLSAAQPRQVDVALKDLESSHLYPEVDLVRGKKYSYHKKPDAEYSYVGLLRPQNFRPFLGSVNQKTPNYHAQVNLSVERYVDSSELADVKAGEQSQTLEYSAPQSFVQALVITRHKMLAGEIGDDREMARVMQDTEAAILKANERFGLQDENVGLGNPGPQRLFVFRAKDDSFIVATSSRGFRRV